jgi:hypothetical protein
MPVFILKMMLKDTENIGTLTVPAEKPWVLDLEQSDGDEVRTKIEIDPTESVEIDGSKGEANLVFKFEGARKQAYVKIIAVKNVTTGGVYNGEQEELQPLVAFECRGCQPSKWYPGCGFVVTSTGGATFDDVDLDEEWADYDGDNDLSVQIMEVESQFESA